MIFLIIAEALTRTVMDDHELKGVHVGGKEVKVSQFADDTQFLLRGYDQLERMWTHIQRYEDATGMRANKRKFEGLRMGRTKRQPVPTTEHTEPIAFVEDGKYIKLLGVPFWEKYDIEEFWNALYAKTKCILASWRDHASLTQIGRSMLANTMIVSRFRYWWHSDSMPHHIRDALESDLEALVWGKDVAFDAEQAGTDAKFRRYLKKNAQYGNRKTDLGIGMLDLESHIRALQVNWLLKYRDGTRGEWKDLLDAWFARDNELGRGAVFSTKPVKEMTKSTTGRRSALPRFWREALATLRELGLNKAHPLRWTLDDARAHPVWDSPIFTVTHRTFIKIWKKLETHRTRDLVKIDGTPYTDDEIIAYFETRYEQSSKGDFYIPGFQPVKRATILKDWHNILKHIPRALLEALEGDQGETWRYSAKAKRIMSNMGWRVGTGAGKHSDGRREPIVADTARASNGRGLGFRKKDEGKQLSTPTFVKQQPQPATTPQVHPKAKERKREKLRAVVTDEGEIVYGYPNKDGMERAHITTKGLPRRTGEQLEVDFSDMREIVRWNGRVMGIAEQTFPHPKEWRLGTATETMDKLTVRALTAAISAIKRVEPSCIGAWQQRIGQLPHDIGARYNNSLLTPKDWHSHFKNVLHRAMVVKGNDPNDKACRACKHEYENLQHFATCEVVGKIFTALAELTDTKLTNKTEIERFALFALRPDGKPVEEGWLNFHLLLWKYIIYYITIAEKEDEKFQTHAIWQAAKQRFEQKVAAKKETLRTDLLRAESRGLEAPNLERKGRCMQPLARVNEEGALEWDHDIVAKIDKLATPPPKKRGNVLRRR